jgi:hypothetical protein
MRRFLATFTLDERPTDQEVQQRLRALAVASHELGIRPVETFVARGEGRAFAFFEAGDEGQVTHALGKAGIRAGHVMEVERVFTELLDEPRRAR